jgi:hypothetical protein
MRRGIFGELMNEPHLGTLLLLSLAILLVLALWQWCQIINLKKEATKTCEIPKGALGDELRKCQQRASEIYTELELYKSQYGPINHAEVSAAKLEQDRAKHRLEELSFENERLLDKAVAQSDQLKQSLNLPNLLDLYHQRLCSNGENITAVEGVMSNFRDVLREMPEYRAFAVLSKLRDATGEATGPNLRDLYAEVARRSGGKHNEDMLDAQTVMTRFRRYLQQTTELDAVLLYAKLREAR